MKNGQNVLLYTMIFMLYIVFFRILLLICVNLCFLIMQSGLIYIKNCNFAAK